MSHKFSFLQVFAGFYSTKSLLLTAFRPNRMLKSLQAGLKAGRYRTIEIVLLADAGKLQIKIYQRSGIFKQMSLYWSALADATLINECYQTLITKPKTPNNQYIQRLKEVLTVSSSDCEYSHIFDIPIVIWRCKYLLHKIGLLIGDSQPDWNCKIYRSLKLLQICY